MNKEKIEISVNEEDVQNIINCYEKDIEYIKQLETNWNELKKWLEERIKYYKEIGYDNTYLALQIALDKMQELERGDSNE